MKPTKQTIIIKDFSDAQRIFFDCRRHPEKYADEVTLKPEE